VPYNVHLADAGLPNVVTGPSVGTGAKGTAGVIAAIRNASASSGMNFEVMLASAKLESGLDPAAEAETSSAAGLYQFIDQTWLDSMRQYGPRHGLSAEAALIVRKDGHLSVDDPKALRLIMDLRKNPDVASAIAGDHLRAISDKLGLTLGRPPDATEIYLGHLLGGGGASQLLQAVRVSPNQAASDLLPAAARANTTLFNAPDGTPYTVTQFMRHLRDRVARAYTSMGAVMPAGPVLSPPRPSASGMANTTATKVASVPWHSRQPIERQAIANLAAVVKKLDSAMGRRESAVRHHGQATGSLPGVLRSTVQGNPAGTAA
jgi:hypothetical protein